MRTPRIAPLLAALATAAALLAPSALGAGPATPHGARPSVAPSAYARAQIAPMVALLESLPHGRELSRLKLFVATDPELRALCGARTMACYDPISERMTVSGEHAEIAGIPRESVIAHEYGHHIANNRVGGIWSAFAAGTPRWSTYERVCEHKRAGEAFPGNQGARYWSNPGEAFAQSYAELVAPTAEWHYSPLFQPDPTALRKLREDVLDPLAPRHRSWRVGAPSRAGPAIESAQAVGAPFARTIGVAYDGRVRVRVRGLEGTRLSAALLDPADGSVLASAGPSPDGVTRLRFASCGHRSLRLEVAPSGGAGSFEVDLVGP